MTKINNADTKTKIVVIGGFLNSGKTTLIKKLGMHYAAAGKVITYFTNEAGKETIDGDLLEYDMNTQEMTAACVTCSLKEVMTSAVGQLIERVHPDILFIEPKETVSPLVVRDELMRSSLKAGTEEYLFAPLLTLIDCSEFFRDIKEKKKVAFDQITVAEVIVLNKTDLVKQNESDLIKESVRQINPNAKILENTIENEIGLNEIIKTIGI
ncbi:putative metal chaperone YciC [Methanimicrococcus sp. At1]|uniref:Metal chaperone YciC n=1 Tax=Methanimicrococcus hacksteinii TaxID=3028293 RepID=A0ABU3VRM7_9EURY|nr:GTP-binding protein [Methanimicrococcus sp. At1]MDV0446073.1 putative metal chaperone YciC [Methanimicrococcus sp. At1]